jgi:putative transposase
MRPIRCGTPNSLFEITTRTVQARMLLKPTAELRPVVLGCIGRAQSLFPVRIHAFCFVSNHYHMLVSADDAQQLSAFVGHVNGNVTREANRLTGWTGSMWSRRFRSVPVSAQQAAQQWRLRYVLSHGVKERLVERVSDWPGASTTPWLTAGEELKGVWHDRTAEYNARRRKGYVPQPGEFETEQVVHMSPLPCWAEVPEAQWRMEVGEMVQAIESEADEADQGALRPVLGIAAVLATDPETRPSHSKRSPAPAVHAVSQQVRQGWRRELHQLRQAYHEASARFRGGQRDVAFPPGTFRPTGGFVGWLACAAA